MFEADRREHRRRTRRQAFARRATKTGPLREELRQLHPAGAVAQSACDGPSSPVIAESPARRTCRCFSGGLLPHKGRMGRGICDPGTARAPILQRLQEVAVISEQNQNAVVSSRRLYEVCSARPPCGEASAVELPSGSGKCLRSGDVWIRPARQVIKDVLLRSRRRWSPSSGHTGAGKTPSSTRGPLLRPAVRLDLHDGARRAKTGFPLLSFFIRSQVRTQVVVFQEDVPVAATPSPPHRVWPAANSRRRNRGPPAGCPGHEFIEQLPKGYETMPAKREVAQRGQRQRWREHGPTFQPRQSWCSTTHRAVEPGTEEIDPQRHETS